MLITNIMPKIIRLLDVNKCGEKNLFTYFTTTNIKTTETVPYSLIPTILTPPSQEEKEKIFFFLQVQKNIKNIFHMMVLKLWLSKKLLNIHDF